MQFHLDSNRIEEKFFSDFKSALNELEALTEANRCLHCYDAPCVRACPTEINIPQFIHRISTGNTQGAARTILNSNILGYSCAVSCPTEVLCEGACVYHQLNKQPIMIGRLQRYAIQEAYQKGYPYFSPGPSTGKKIALIGAGPASLACAHELRKKGHETILFEKSSLPGGLNTQGIAPYKMKAAASLWEIEEIAKIGIRFEFNQELGRNINLSALLSEFDAIFLGMGLGPDSRLEVRSPLSNQPSNQHPRLKGAVEFISQLKLGKTKDLDWLQEVKTALVIGAGNTALDACRELKYLGIPHVIVSYRRDEKSMSGYVHEFKLARQQGVEFLFYTIPFELNSLGSEKLKISLRKTLLTDQDQVQMTDETFDLQAELVLVATGQSRLQALLSNIEGLEFQSGRLMVDPKTGRTGHPKIFAGGDLVNGGMEVVNAVAEGKRAALSIHEVITHG